MASGPVATHLLLVANNLPEHELLIGATAANVMAITVEFDTWALLDLQQAIQDRCGLASHQFSAVAILGHGQPGYFEILKSVQKPADDKRAIEEEVIAFCGWLGDYVHPDGQIHLLGCEVAEGPDGQKLLKALQEATDREVTGSSRKHGAGVDVTDEFYWGLSKARNRGPSRHSGTEDRTHFNACSQEQIIDAANLYFEETKLQTWVHTVTDEFYWGLSKARNRGPSRHSSIEVTDQFNLGLSQARSRGPSRHSSTEASTETTSCREEHFDAARLYFEEAKLQKWVHTAGLFQEAGKQLDKVLGGWPL